MGEPGVANQVFSIEPLGRCSVTASITVGVCAYNEERRIPRLLASVLGQALPDAYTLDEVLVVASGCTDATEARVVEAGSRDARVRLIREASRNGKASAINLLLAEFRGDILVLVNADAELRPGSLENLLEAFREDASAQVACGSVVLEDGEGGLHTLVEDLQWRIHNRSLQALAVLGSGNHCCDEFMALRRGFLTKVPPELINDGAYIGVYAALRGETIRYRPGAEVLVDAPRSIRGIVQQRIRILRGHRQVRRLLGLPPNTIEGLATTKPDLALRLLRASFRDRPARILPFLVVALPVELYALTVSSWQELTREAYQPAWNPVE